MSRFQYYNNNIFSRDFLLKTQEQNVMKVPFLSKIVLNTSIKNSNQGTRETIVSSKGSSTSSASNLQDKSRFAQNLSSLIALEMICGQKSKKTRSQKFIAGFKLRKGELIACKVTLRDVRMFSFLEKLQMIVFPKLRDFQGLSALRARSGQSFRDRNVGNISATTPGRKRSQKDSFDNHGNISFGLQNFLLFPELESHYELFESLKGFQVTLVTKMFHRGQNHEEVRLLLTGNQMPL